MVLVTYLALLLLPGCSAYFGITHPSLEAQVTLKPGGFWHLGGFCFGQDDGHVAVLELEVYWSGSKPLSDGNVHLVAFDGRESHWGVVSKDWDTSSCDEKLRMAPDSSTQLGKIGRNYTAGIKVFQRTGVRDWHFALLSCGSVEPAELKLKLEALEGALSYFRANTQFDDSSCPVVPGSWWEHASSAAGFWVMLFFVVLCSAGLAISIGCTVRLKQQAQKTAAGNEIVIGRPCAVRPDQEIAAGQPHDEKMQP